MHNVKVSTCTSGKNVHLTIDHCVTRRIRVNIKKFRVNNKTNRVNINTNRVNIKTIRLNINAQSQG